MHIEIWSDIVCPWCYLGKRRFEHALQDFDGRDDVQVVHRAFQLDPTAAKDKPVSQLDMLVSKYGAEPDQIREQWAQLTQLAAAEGLEYRFEGGLTGNTFDAHRLVKLALERGLQEPVIERFFRAQFTEQRSLFDAESLVELATEAGLDRDETAMVVKGDTYTAAVQADITQAREYGANGVPFFVIDSKYGISGAQPTAVFAGALDRAAEETGTAPHPR
jgi:predicted DsbA family dithiol-disulfide isomerase